MSAESTNAESFKKNYDTLQSIAEKLKNQTEPDIDQLVPWVEEATQAYKACKARLDAVEAALKEKLEDENTDQGQK